MKPRDSLMDSFCFAAIVFCVSQARVLAIGPTPPSWQPRQTVASAMVTVGDHNACDRAMAYDHHGNPGIAFSDSVNGVLRYAEYLRGIGWSHSIVDPAVGSGLYPSLAFDAYERPAISYYDNVLQDLKYAAWNGTSWQISVLDSSGDTGWWSSLAFDVYGRPAIAFVNLTASTLRFIHDQDGDGFGDEVAETVALGSPIYPTLAFDLLNRPMIGFVASDEGGNFLLRFAIRGVGGWVSATVESPISGGPVSLAAQPESGHPAIAYNGNGGALRYAAWNGSAWVLTTVDFGFQPSLAFDPADGRPAISYLLPNILRFAWFDGAVWQTQTVDAAGAVGTNSSLAFNDFGNGFPSIAYFASVFGPPADLYFIEDPPVVMGDSNGDLIVNVLDLLKVIESWGPCASKNECAADLNEDGEVNVLDLLEVISHWS